MQKSVFVALPIHRHWSRESQDYFQRNLKVQTHWKLNTIYKHYGESLIQRARHNIMHKFLESKADFLFFLDDDIVMTTENTIDLLVAANKDIIGGCYILKSAPYTPVFMPFEDKYPDLRIINDPVLVRYVSTGCMLIKRCVVEKIAAMFKYPFECFETEIEKTDTGKKELIYLSEDWAFCDRANKLGYKCFIHPVPVLGHLGIYPYSLADWYAMQGK